MHTDNLSAWTHEHVFDTGNALAERSTWVVMWITAAAMVVEITAGWWFNSMALLADGWHMSSHALAIGLAALAYAASRKYARDSRFAFGTWKIEVLGGYTSALCLVGVAGLMLYHSVQRLFAPVPIHYNQAILLAILGLAVNLVCAVLLRDSPDHHHGHEHHGHDHHDHDHQDHDRHQDLNLRSAYLHVLTDAATSVLAIVALTGGKFWGADWLDPVMGLVGAGLVGIWAFGLLRDTGRVLLDAEMDAPVVAEIVEVIEQGPVAAEIVDFHVWRVGRGKYACILSLLVEEQVAPEQFKERLSVHDELVHVTVEVNQRPQLEARP